MNSAFSLFYRFLKIHKQYVFNNKIPHHSYLCEICENASLLVKGLENACKRKEIQTDPQSMVEIHSCNDADIDCMISNCHACHFYGLAKKEFSPENKASSDTSLSEIESVPDVTIKFYHLHKNVIGYLPKTQITLDMCYALERWQEVMAKAYFQQKATTFIIRQHSQKSRCERIAYQS